MRHKRTTKSFVGSPSSPQQAKKSVFKKRLEHNLKLFSEMIEAGKGAGSDLIRVAKKGGMGPASKGRQYVPYLPPLMGDILEKNGTMLPMPIVLAYTPPAYFRIFSRFVLATMDPNTLRNSGKPMMIEINELFSSLSKIDRARFAEVIKFLLHSKIITAKKAGNKLFLALEQPYKFFCFPMSTAAMSVVSKTNMIKKNQLHISADYKWNAWAKILPISVNFEDFFGGE